MSGSLPEPSPTRAPPDVWAESAQGQAPGFTRVNGVALGLMLIVDVLFGAALLRGEGYNALLWILAPYALGLTVGVALIRPRPHRRTEFAFFLSPVLLQIATYLLFWGGTAGWWVLLPTVDMLAHTLFFVGFAFALLLAPFTRRSGVLVVTECGPLALVLLVGYLL